MSKIKFTMVKSGLMLISPILLWFFLFKDFISGRISCYMDTYCIYALFKFFYNNLFNGVIPSWDPFVTLGIPYINVSSSGVLNPFMALMAMLHFFGFNYFQSFYFFIIFYFIIGLLGFYLFVYYLVKDQALAWIAYVLLLFSGMGPMLFNQVDIGLLFTPTVWFFVFLYLFSKNFEIKYFLGIITALSNILCSYYPFYFLTLLLFFILLIIVIYPSKLWDFLKGFFIFVTKNKILFISCFILLAMLLLPLLSFKYLTNGQDQLFLSRRLSTESIDITKLEINKFNNVEMNFNEVSTGGTLGERMNGGRLFSHLDKFSHVSDSFMYLPFFVYLCVFMGIIVEIGRKQLFVGSLAVIIFLLSMGQVSFLHQLLYNSIFYFKFFRNFFFFSAFLMPLVIAFAMLQLSKLLDSYAKSFNLKKFIILITVLHILVMALLLYQGNILFSTYLTVIFGYFVFLITFLKKKLYLPLFFVLIILEPITVFVHYRVNAANFKFPIPSTHVVPVFSFNRPIIENDGLASYFKANENYGSFLYDILLKDSTGYIPDRPLIVSKYPYVLSRQMDMETFNSYIKHKFYIYDDVISEDKLNLSDKENIFKNKMNLAFVSNPTGANFVKSVHLKSTAGIILSNRADFKVISFSVNELKLKTNFKTEKFLVYTDIFQKNWKVYINGQQVQLFRANGAFKGVFIPAGPVEVLFKYMASFQQFSYLFVLVLNIFILIFFLRSLCLR